MPTTINGRRLGVEANGFFTEVNTDPIPGGRLWVPAARSWNRMRAAFIADGGDPDDFMPAGPASSSRTLGQQDYFWENQPPPAAKPGTSNHGWGIAVDVKTRAAAAWIMAHGHKYGWSHDEGERVGEWWHFRMVRVVDFKDALAGYTDSEKRWIREYDKLKAANSDAGRRRVLRRVMEEQRQRIWRAAQPRKKGGDGKGWTRVRRRRYESLKARTTTGG